MLNVPSGGVVDLKKKAAYLRALVVGRALESGIGEFFEREKIPAPFRRLIDDKSWPERGTVVSSSSVVKSRPAKGVHLEDWAKSNRKIVDECEKHVPTALRMLCEMRLMGWSLSQTGDCHRTDVGAELHDGFMREFAWEFLAGSPVP
jgi:hypothetical protein